jgi:hypothetical protein
MIGQKQRRLCRNGMGGQSGGPSPHTPAPKAVRQQQVGKHRYELRVGQAMGVILSGHQDK